jgi:MFS family permease
MDQSDTASDKRGIIQLLRSNRDFRLLFTASVISFSGDWFLFVALAGLLFDLTHSPGLVASLYAAMTVPFALGTFVGGPLADRLNRKYMMIAADVCRGTLALGFFLIHDRSQVWLIFVLSGLLSLLQAGFEPAANAAIPNLVDRADLATANILGAATWGTMLAVGSAIGGLVVAYFGRGAGYIGDSVSFFLSAVLVTQIRRPFSESREERADHPSMLTASRETFRYARKDHRVLALLTVKGGFGLGAGVIALLPILAFTTFHAGDRGTGTLYAFRGAGIVLGPFLIRPFVKDNDLRTLFWGISIAFGIFAATYSVAAFMPSIYLAGAFVFAAHLGGGAQWTLSSYGLQLIVPDRIRGRIFAFDEALISLTIALSATVAGWFANFFDARAVMVGLAAVAGAYAIVWTVATRNVRRSFAPEPTATKA